MAAANTRDALYRRLLGLADLLAAGLAFLLVIRVVGHDSLGVGVLVAVPMVILVCKLAGLYDRDEHLLHKTTLDEAPALFRVAGLYTLLAFLAGELIVVGTLGREQAIALWGLLFVFMLGLRYAARQIAAALATEERCLIVSKADAARWLSVKLERSHGTKVDVVGRVPLSLHDAGTGELPVLGDVNKLEEILVEHEIDRALVAPGETDTDHRLLNVIRTLKKLDVRVTVLPRLFEVVGAAVEFDEVEGAALLGVRHHGLTRSSRFVKRSFDLVICLAALPLLAPLMAMIAIAIKLDSRGPVFFHQRRVGERDQFFEIIKFRTMVVGAEAERDGLVDRNEAGGGLFKIEADPRVTRVGRFLRKTSLDELPQLLNVLRGDMSLVGPRPLVGHEDRLIEGPKRYRLVVPTGVTGLWQIHGSARIPLDEMVKIDYLYGANWSLWLDIKILLRTVPFVLGQRGL